MKSNFIWHLAVEQFSKEIGKFSD